jgi:hypothetical protein
MNALVVTAAKDLRVNDLILLQHEELALCPVISIFNTGHENVQVQVQPGEGARQEALWFHADQLVVTAMRAA